MSDEDFQYFLLRACLFRKRIQTVLSKVFSFSRDSIVRFVYFCITTCFGGSYVINARCLSVIRLGNKKNKIKESLRDLLFDNKQQGRP